MKKFFLNIKTGPWNEFLLVLKEWGTELIRFEKKRQQHFQHHVRHVIPELTTRYATPRAYSAKQFVERKSVTIFFMCIPWSWNSVCAEFLCNICRVLYIKTKILITTQTFIALCRNATENRLVVDEILNNVLDNK